MELFSSQEMGHARRLRALAVNYLTAAAVVYAAIGIAAMWRYAPRAPYADQWRHYAALLMRPLNAVFTADNGHFEVLPNLLRLADLNWFGGNEILQIGSGIVLAIGAVTVLLRVVLGDRSSSPVVRSAAACSVVFAIYWLGNARALGQDGDSVHVYLVLLCLALALTLVLRRGPAHEQMRAVVPAVLLCLLASFSFGSGIASFFALFMLLLVQRSPWAHQLIVLGGAAVALLLYVVLPGSLRPLPDHGLEPLHAVQVMLQLLGAPFVYLFWPLLDPAAAAAVPEPLARFARDAADLWTANFGAIRTSVFPQAAIGAAVLGVACRTTWLAASTTLSRSSRLGIALAWFGVGCAALIALSRGAYFVAYPEQVYALRYLPWSSVCWSGLLLATVTRTHGGRLALGVALLLPLLALPSELGMLQLMNRMQTVAQDTALDAAAGVVPASQALGETSIDDLRVALPALRDRRVAMFAWPETSALAQPVPPGALLLAPATVDSEPVVNLLDGIGVRVSARLAPVPCAQRVLVAADGHGVGLLRRTKGDEWSGVATGQLPGSQMKFFGLCD